VTPPDVAEIVTAVTEVTAVVVTRNPTVVAPAGTATLAGTGATAVLLLDSVTVTPPDDAAPLRVIVAVDEVPPCTLLGLRLIETSVGVGMTVSAADRVTPPDVAEIVTVCADVTAVVDTVNPTVVAPGGTVTLAGTAAASVLLLDRVTTTPPAGAAALSVTVPEAGEPALTLVGWILNDVNVADGVTKSWANRTVASPVAEIGTVVDVITGLVDTVNVAVVLPGGTVTLPGTVATAVLVLDSVTTTPPAGAAALSVTVPVDVPPPETLIGSTLSDVTPGPPTAVQVTPPSVLFIRPE
jgi:hypothetical protein